MCVCVMCVCACVCDLGGCDLGVSPLGRRRANCTLVLRKMAPTKLYLVKTRSKKTAWNPDATPPPPIELRRVDDIDGRPAYEMAFWYTFCYDAKLDSYVCKDVSRKKASWTRAYQKCGNTKNVLGTWSYTRTQPGARSEFDHFKIVDKIEKS